MAPAPKITGELFEDDKMEDITVKGTEPENESTTDPAKSFKEGILWGNVLLFAYFHLAAIYGVYLIFTSAKSLTITYAIFLSVITGFGITAGAHRLWTHRAYKAKLPLRILLLILNTMAAQKSVIRWARDHRVHHKYTDTNADPHTITRGFFFAHIGWLLVRKNPEVIKSGKGIDVSDLTSDPLLKFQQKHYTYVMPLVAFILPSLIPVYYWGETWTNAWFVSAMFRFVSTLNTTLSVNSAAHKWGNRPYEKGILPAENLAVSIGALGEGWHNYHHIFPWDYKTSELGYYRANFSTALIDFMAKIGWAYDLQTVPASIVKSRVERTGDGSHEVWGWGDPDMPKEDREEAITLHKKDG